MSKNKPSKKKTVSLPEGEIAHRDSFLQFIISAFVIIMPLLFCKWNDQSPFEMIKAYFSTLSVCLMLGYYLIKNVFADRIQLRWNLWIVGLLIYTFCYYLSFAFAGHYYSALWGVLNLPAGSVMTVTTFVVFSFLSVQVFTDHESFVKLARAFVFTAFLMSIYGVIQHFGGDPINWWVYNEMHLRALSTMGQSVGYGTVLGCCLPLCFAFLINSTTTKRYIFWIVAFIFLNMGILYSGSRLPIFGYFVVMLIYLAFILIFRKRLPFLNWKKVGVAYLLIVICTSVYYVDGNNALREKLEIKAIKNGYGTRFIVWNTAFEMWKKNPILGVGPENFGEEFNHVQTIEQNYGESWNLIWHKAHNEFIHYLVTTGAVGFAAYLMLILLMFVPTFKTLKDKEWTPDYLYSVGLLGGFGFLLLTHMTAFSFIPTLMFFYLFPAMNFNFAGLSRVIDIENKTKKNTRYVMAGAVVIVLGFIMHKVFGVWIADMNYNDARRALVSQGNVDKANELLEKAISQNPGNAEYWCFRADIYYNQLARSLRDQGALADQKKRQLFDEVIRSSDTCVQMDDRKSDLWRARGTLFMSLSQMVPQMLEGSLQAFKKAVEVYPNNPYNHISVAQVYRRKGRNDLALESLNASIARRRDIIPAYAEMLSIYYQDKRYQDIRTLVDSVRALDIKKSEFKVNMPAMIKIARDNNDPRTANELEVMLQ